MTFSVRNFLRQISMKTLKAYFESKNAAVPPEWWKYKEPKRVSELAGYLISGTDQIGEAILGDLVRIHPMASERGRNALLNSSSLTRNPACTRFTICILTATRSSGRSIFGPQG
jgi:hypothetical protein